MRRSSPVRVPRGLAAAALVLALGGCGGNSSSEARPASPEGSTSSSPSQAPVAAIVGRWTQRHSCPNLVRAFRSAGLGDIAALQAAAFGPDRPESEMPTPQELRARAAKLQQGGDLCAGAHRPFRHSHFFTSSGSFGSLDQHLQQVDDGTYRVRGDTLVFGKNRFRYRVTGRDTLALTPLLTRKQRQEALARPMDFTDATWMVSVAYAGSTWHRVPCNGWC